MYHNHNKEEKLNLSRFASLIEGFTRTGFEMLESTMNSKEILKTDLAPFLLFRQTLEMGDALSTLIRSGSINASKPLVRTLLEGFQLAYLFNENEERKALQFLYHYERRKKEYYENLAFPKKKGSYFEKLKKDKHLRNDDINADQKKVYRENVKKIETILNEEGNKIIAEEYTRTENEKTNKRTGKKGKVSHWYELFDGPTSIEGISIELDESGLYQFIYRNCSSYAHVEDIVHANLVPYDGVSFKISPLRDLRQLSIVANDILLLIEQSSMLFLKNKVEDKKMFAEKFFPFILKKREYTKILKTKQ
jgi:Family of unknown function (DUF5677)